MRFPLSRVSAWGTIADAPTDATPAMASIPARWWGRVGLLRHPPPCACRSYGVGKGRQGPQQQHGERGPTAKALLMKLASRLFQRAVTPTDVVRHASPHELGVDPGVQKVAAFVVGQVKGRTYDRVKRELLLRVSSGFGLMLPGLGIFFAGKGLLKGIGRTTSEIAVSAPAAVGRRPCDRGTGEGGAATEGGHGRAATAAPTAFALSTAADGVNLISQVGGFGHALRDSTLSWPGLMDNPLTWWSDTIALPPAWGLSLAVLSTVAGAAGEVWCRYPSLRAFLHDKVPKAAVHGQQAVDMAGQAVGQAAQAAAAAVGAEGAASVQQPLSAASTSAGAAVRTAARAVDVALEEGMPDMTHHDKVGEAAAEGLGVPTTRLAEAVNETAREAARALEREAQAAAQTRAGAHAPPGARGE